MSKVYEQHLCSKCRRCGRPLKTHKAQLRGYGNQCYQMVLKEQQQKRKSLFNTIEVKS